MDIGFIGVGNMGAGMANNLLKAGHTLTIHELVRERATPLLEQGAKWADSPREVAEASPKSPSLLYQGRWRWKPSLWVREACWKAPAPARSTLTSAATR